MNKELEEVINWLKSNIKYYNEQIEFIKATDCDYYDEEQSLYEKRIKIFENILNYIDNSISKEVIKEKIEEYKQQLKNNTKRVVQLQVLEQNKSLQQNEWEELNTLFGDIEKIKGKLEVLQELLEGK